MQIHTFHQSAAIWFYTFDTIISKNLPLLSDSIQSIDQLFHLNQTRPCYQTLYYYYRKYPTPCANPYIPLISCNLILLIIRYHFEKYPPVKWFHTIYWSDVSFTLVLSPLSESTLLFSKIPHPPVQVHTFHQSAAIWFYRFYTIISKNTPLLSYSILSINQIFHLHLICPSSFFPWSYFQ